MTYAFPDEERTRSGQVSNAIAWFDFQGIDIAQRNPMFVAEYPGGLPYRYELRKWAA